MEDKLQLLDDIIQNQSKDLWKFINEPKNLLIIEDIINNNKNNKIKLLYNRLLNPVQPKFGENISNLNQEFIEKQLLEWNSIDMICKTKLYKDMNDDDYQLFLIFYYFYILFIRSTKTSRIFYLNCFILNYLKKNPEPSITLFDEKDTDKKLKDSKYEDKLKNKSKNNKDLIKYNFIEFFNSNDHSKTFTLNDLLEFAFIQFINQLHFFEQYFKNISDKDKIV